MADTTVDLINMVPGGINTVAPFLGVIIIIISLRCACSKSAEEAERDKALAWWKSTEDLNIPYAPEEHVFASLLRWRGTAMEMILTKPLFYLLVGMHILLRALNDTYSLPLPALDSTVLVGLPSSLLIFLVVFYGGNWCVRLFLASSL